MIKCCETTAGVCSINLDTGVRHSKLLLFIRLGPYLQILDLPEKLVMG
jgi:hypothetical protein